MPIRILIADDHHLVADSLSLLLDTVPIFEVAGAVSNGWQALSHVENHDTDVVLADFQMPLLNGIDMTMRMREQAPKVKVIMLTMSEEPTHIRQALQAGVHGYVMKSAERPELIKAIQTVAAGEKYFSEKIVRKLAEIPDLNNPDGKASITNQHSLTPREIEVMHLIVKDLPNVAIGAKLNISPTTVETHRSNIFKKVGVSSALGLLRWALKHKLIDEI